MTIWDDAGAVIDSTFADLEPPVYTSLQFGLLGAVAAIKIDEAAGEFDRQGRNLRRITWEIPQSFIPGDASNRDSMTHAGRRWNVLEATRRDDIGKWWLVVQDEGAI